MIDNYLIPWYALETDASRQKVYNRSISAVYIYKPQPKSKPKPNASQEIVYRPADLVLMELTVKARKDVREGITFEWPEDDFYHDICTSWFNEQKAKGLNDIVFLCGEASMKATGKFVFCCLVCWYDHDHAQGFVPSQKDGMPVIEAVNLDGSFRKPMFADNAEEFKEALQAIADFVPFDGWKKKFQSGLAIMQNEMLRFSGQANCFDIDPPYFRYLCAAQFTQLGAGMGSWSDLPIAGTESFKTITRRFSNARDNAIMYAINNC